MRVGATERRGNYSVARRGHSVVALSQRLVWPLGAIILTLILLRMLPVPLKHVFTVIFTAILLAATISPAAQFMSRFHVPRSFTILLIYIVFLVVLGGIIYLIIPLVVREVNTLRSSLPSYAGEIQRLVARVAPDQAEKFSVTSVANQISGKLSEIAGRLTNLVVALVSASIDAVLVLVIAFFMAVEEDFAKQLVVRFVPPEGQPKVQRMMTRIGTRLGQWARAQALLALFFGVAYGVGLRVLGIHYAVTLATIGGVLEIIPYVGGFVTVMTAVLVALTQNPILVFAVAGWYVVVVELQGHVLAPKLMNRVLKIHPLVIVLALFLGGEALGILGALLAVPIAIVAQVLLDEFYRFDVAPELAAVAAETSEPSLNYANGITIERD